MIHDFHGRNRWLTVPEIFIYSSNIGAARMAIDVGTARQRAFFARLGMLSAAPIELGEVGKPLMPRRWREINTMTISFGHGLSVSPLHLASGVAAVVNGGIYYTPTIVRRDTPRAFGRRVLSASTSEKLRRLMRLVVDRGTGRKAGAIGYLVGGKTGTAEKVRGRSYSKRALLSSFVGAFPMTEPRYVILAMLDEAKGRKETLGYATGGWVAAPVVRRVVERMAPMMGMAPVKEDSPGLRELELYVKAEGRKLASY